jgi:hypothetical protein
MQRRCQEKAVVVLDLETLDQLILSVQDEMATLDPQDGLDSGGSARLVSLGTYFKSCLRPATLRQDPQSVLRCNSDCSATTVAPVILRTL